MKDIDEIRGAERQILFSPTGGHTRRGYVPISNCVVETKQDDSVARSPILSLRFYHKLTGGAIDEETPIGVEIDLGPELAQSVIEQLQTQWPHLRGML